MSLKIQEWSLDKFREYPNNPRINDHAVDQMAAMIKEFGFRVPVIAKSNGDLIDGHLRLKAARLLELKKLPVVIADDLTDAQVKALRIAVNQAAQLAEWDMPMLASELADLQLAGFDLPVLGFNELELQNILGTEPEGNDPEATPEIPKTPIIKRGDLWKLGEHRLLCDDANATEAWARLHQGKRAAMVFTDPPYGVSYKATSGNFEIIEGDKKRRDELYKMLLTAFKQAAAHTIDRAAFYIWHASSTREDFAQAMTAAGLIERQYLIWVKAGIVLGHSDYHWQHEPCFYASKGSTSPAFYGDRSQSAVWRVNMVDDKNVSVMVGQGVLLLNGTGGTLYIQSKAPKNKKLRQIRIRPDQQVLLAGSDQQDGTVWEIGRDGTASGGGQHPTQKPVELARRAIENSSQAGEIVSDSFLGSGTTMIAAEMTGRACYGLEIDPKYAQVAIERWQTFTGKPATLEATGQTFEQVRTEGRREASPKSGAGSAPARKKPAQKPAAAAAPPS